MMTNAKQEFLKHVAGYPAPVKCVLIEYGGRYTSPVKHINLKVGASQEEFNAFLKKLDFEYDSGYGGQELFGFIWYDDGTWSGRGEYDGSEWWEHCVCPEIPDELK